MGGYQFGTSLRTSDVQGYNHFVSMQPHYNLCYREQERELLPLCHRVNIAVMSWSPLARGYLAHPHEEFKNSSCPEADHWVLDNPMMSAVGRRSTSKSSNSRLTRGPAWHRLRLLGCCTRMSSRRQSLERRVSNTSGKPLRRSTSRHLTAIFNISKNRTNRSNLPGGKGTAYYSP